MGETNCTYMYSQSTGFECFHTGRPPYAPTTLVTHSGPADASPLPTPSRWNHAVTALLLPGHGRVPECERAKH
eukprot:6390809-Prymnesium_polylepis.1